MWQEHKNSIVSVMLMLALLLIVFEYFRISGSYTLTDDGCNTTINSPMCCGFNYLPNKTILLVTCNSPGHWSNPHEVKNTIIDVTNNQSEYVLLAWHAVSNSAEHKDRQDSLNDFVFKDTHL